MRLLISVLLIAGSLIACQRKNMPTNNEAALRAKADKLAHDNIIVDGHVDLPYRLKVQNFRLTREYIGIPVETKEGDFDYVRAKKGGLSAPFMSIYIPSDYQIKGGARQLADSLIDMVTGIADQHPDKFARAFSTQQVKQNYQKGLISLPMGMENGAPIGDDLGNVAYFHKRGIRYITLTHATDNQICDSAYDTTRTWNGLSPFGRQVVEEMNKVGIMVDISHVSDSTFYQVMALSKAPCIASHSSLRHFTPGFERNMNDDMIKLLGQKDGVIMINFGSTFLDGTIAKKREELRAELSALLAEKGLNFESPEAKPIMEQFSKEHPGLYADVEMVANHIDRVRQLAGIDHIGLGSDFDGVGDSLPTGLKDVSQYPNLIYVLLRRGYSDEDIAKICYKNVFRVWSKVEEMALANKK